MKKTENTSYYIAWGALYVICAGLSFIPEPQGALNGLMLMLSLGFFVPPALLLYRAVKQRRWNTVRLLRWISSASLVLTFVMLLVNFLSFDASDAAGLVLNGLLILVSVPMICSGAWVLSLFLWALLLMLCLKYRKNRENAYEM